MLNNFLTLLKYCFFIGIVSNIYLCRANILQKLTSKRNQIEQAGNTNLKLVTSGGELCSSFITESLNPYNLLIDRKILKIKNFNVVFDKQSDC